MILPNAIKGFFRRFRKETSATVAVEAVIILPILFWAYMAMFVFFDAFRQTSINQKAAFTIGDMLSRETTAINNDYLDGLDNMFKFLARSDDTARLRVTVVRWHEKSKKFRRDWSQTRGDVDALTASNVADMTDVLPVVPDGERIILVETWSHYTAPFNIGPLSQDLHNRVFTRPRFAPKLVWES
ncbi:TadE/TadG family type IV pilus assembly protein, partial [Sediminimonas qiaohouensis]|uniref:TadE/TadG family type IV pilus assembly protein n=1 Tax=Sediminimonas qiaohouensis TaxID=552061 RepID=UPI0003F8724D